MFALLDDDNEEPQAPAQKAPAQKKQSDKVDKPNQERKPKQGKGDGERRPRNDNRNQGSYDGSDKPQKPGENEGRKGGRRRNEEGGGRKGGRKGDSSKPHDGFDRRSGRGKGKGGEKREGGGKYNWGEKTEAAPAAAEGTETEAAAEPEPEPEPEEEENTMTLDEYMKSQTEKKGLPTLGETRKITDSGEGFKTTESSTGDDDELYGMIFHAYDGKDKKAGAREAREGWVQADDVLNMKFSEPERAERPAKGGKGDDRRKGKEGGKGKGGRGKKSSGPGLQADLSSDAAFPALG
jgi:hypothetical protein